MHLHDTTSRTRVLPAGPTIPAALAILGMVASLLIAIASPADAATFTREAGNDRIQTAIEVSRAAFPGGADVAILADAGGFADALASAPLAGAEGAPVLLNTPAGLDDRVEDEIDRLDPDTVIVMGGERVQSPAVVTALEAQGREVVRLGGDSRWATAALAADRAVDRWVAQGANDAGVEVVIALGDHPGGPSRSWPDALAAGVLAGRTNRPLLLVHRDVVPQETKDAIIELGAERAIVVGGIGAIPNATANDLGVPFSRIAGDNRYDTGARLADAAVLAGADPGDLWVVTGEDFPDALGAVPAVLETGGVLLLVNGQTLDGSPDARNWIEDEDIDTVTVVGGESVVTPNTVEQIRAAIDGTAEVRLGLREVASANTALGIRFDDRNRLVVAERNGRVVVHTGSGPVTLLDIRNQVSTSGERGLLDLQFHPDFATNRRFFVHYSGTNGDTVLSEWTADAAGTGIVGGESQLYRTGQPASNHNGGGLQFIPDGTLLLALGDGGGADDTFGNGENVNTPLGSLLRFDVSTPGQASAPSDNPYVGRTGDDFIWAYGLRNPFRITYDAGSGLLITADVGQNTWEEINAVPWNRANVNYGWSTKEGPDCFRTPVCDESGRTDPIAWYSHNQGRCSITGGHVHRGGIPGLDGHYFYGDFCNGQIFSFEVNADGSRGEIVDRTGELGFSGNPFTFGIDNDGDVYVANSDRIFKIVRA